MAANEQDLSRIDPELLAAAMDRLMGQSGQFPWTAAAAAPAPGAAAPGVPAPGTMAPGAVAPGAVPMGWPYPPPAYGAGYGPGFGYGAGWGAAWLAAHQAAAQQLAQQTNPRSATPAQGSRSLQQLLIWAALGAGAAWILSDAHVREALLRQIMKLYGELAVGVAEVKEKMADMRAEAHAHASTPGNS